MSWSVNHLERVLDELRHRRGDTASIEVKRASHGLPKMAETLCAFANMPQGGTVILGVDEADGAFDIVGVDDIAKMEAGLISMARQSVHPSPYIDCEALRISQCDVLVAHIQPVPMSERPARFKGQAYLRQADGDYKMQSHEIRMIQVAQLYEDQAIEYDLKPATGRSVDDLDADLVASYIDDVRRTNRRLTHRSDADILRQTNVLNKDEVPTLAGLYALGDYPQGQYPALTVTAAIQLQGGEGQARVKNRRDFTGPIPVLLDDIMEWVRNAVPTISGYTSTGHMVDTPEVPLNAVRELVANALVHRDVGPDTLGKGKSVQIRLAADRLFIQSPGGLKGVSVEQLTSVEHAQAAVNQHIYALAKHLTTADGYRVIEGEGGGIAEVLRACEDRGMAPPILNDTGVQFTATLWRDNNSQGLDVAATSVSPEPIQHNRRLSDAVLPHSSAPTRNEPLVIKALSSTRGGLTIHELADRAGLSLGQVRYALAAPLKEGIVLMDGRQGVRETMYVLRA